MPASQTQRRYSAVAMTLHWIIAAMIIVQIFYGWWMGDLPNGSEKLRFYQIHKSIGLTILVLSVARLAWRLTHKRPAHLPMAKWEKRLAELVHGLFYVLIIGLPLLGWAMVSASTLNVPTQYFFLFEWPHLPLLPDLGRDTKETLAGMLETLHSSGAWVILVLLGLHVAGALKHQFIDRTDELQRMIPIPFRK